MGPRGYHQVHNNSHYKGARKREREGYKNVVENIMFENFPNLKMETDRYQVQDHKQDNPFNIHTQHN